MLFALFFFFLYETIVHDTILHHTCFHHTLSHVSGGRIHHTVHIIHCSFCMVKFHYILHVLHSLCLTVFGASHIVACRCCQSRPQAVITGARPRQLQMNWGPMSAAHLAGGSNCQVAQRRANHRGETVSSMPSSRRMALHPRELERVFICFDTCSLKSPVCTTTTPSLPFAFPVHVRP